MTRIHVKNDIEITRNPIEKLLMFSKRFAKENRRLVLAGLMVFFLSVVILLISIIVISSVTADQRVQFEKLNKEFQVNIHENNIEKARNTISEMNSLADSSYFGFVGRMGHYYVGNYHYQLGDYKEAREALQVFVDSSSKNMFWELACLKIGVIYQESGDFEKALAIYKKIENDYREGVILDQLYYYIANAYVSLKDNNNAGIYYNRVINEFPRSSYADMARKRLFLLGAG